MGYTKFNEDVFIIDSWTDTIEKENTLIELIKRIKVFNVPIILATHYAVIVKDGRIWVDTKL